MKYTLISGDIKLTYNSFARATSKLVALGSGKLFYGRVLVGEL